MTSGKVSKRLRKLAKLEMSGNAQTVDRELVLARVRGADRVINEPLTVRAFYLKLKSAYADYSRGVRKVQPNQSDF